MNNAPLLFKCSFSEFVLWYNLISRLYQIESIYRMHTLGTVDDYSTLHNSIIQLIWTRPPSASISQRKCGTDFMNPRFSPPIFSETNRLAGFQCCFEKAHSKNNVIYAGAGNILPQCKILTFVRIWGFQFSDFWESGQGWTALRSLNPYKIHWKQLFFLKQSAF